MLFEEAPHVPTDSRSRLTVRSDSVRRRSESLFLQPPPVKPPVCAVHEIESNAVCVVRPRLQGSHCAQPGCNPAVPEVEPMSINGQAFRRVSGLCDRPCETVEARRRGCAEQHAVADEGGGPGQGQGGVIRQTGRRYFRWRAVKIRGPKTEKGAGLPPAPRRLQRVFLRYASCGRAR